VSNVDTRGTHTARRVTRMNQRNGSRCPRCRRFGIFARDSIVCNRCIGANVPPLIITVTTSLTIAIAGGEW
jgi:hypothetical protein